MATEMCFSNGCAPLRYLFFPVPRPPPSSNVSSTLSWRTSPTEPSVPSPTIVGTNSEPSAITVKIIAHPSNHLGEESRISSTDHICREFPHGHDVDAIGTHFQHTSGFRETPCEDQHSLSLTNYNHCLGDARVVPYQTKEIRGYTTISTAIALAERADTDDNIAIITRSALVLAKKADTDDNIFVTITRSAKMWLEKEHRAQHSREQARMEAMQMARNIWANVRRNMYPG